MSEDTGARKNKKDNSSASDDGLSPMARVWIEAGPYLAIGWMFVASIAGLGALGWWLDRVFGTGRALFLAGCLFGIVVGFVSFFKIVLTRGTGQKR